MTAFVVLLRGVNVGGNNKVPMAQLRAALTANGFDKVQTYIQSGNVVVWAEEELTSDAVAVRVADTIRTDLGVDVPAVAVSRSTLESVVKANPFSAESDPKKVHVLFLLDPKKADAKARLAEVVSAAKSKRDAGERAALIGPAVYLHTPDGFGDSELAKVLSARRSGIDSTARNWRTVLTLLGMVREAEADS